MTEGLSPPCSTAGGDTVPLTCWIKNFFICFRYLLHFPPCSIVLFCGYRFCHHSQHAYGVSYRRIIIFSIFPKKKPILKGRGTSLDLHFRLINANSKLGFCYIFSTFTGCAEFFYLNPNNTGATCDVFSSHYLRKWRVFSFYYLKDKSLNCPLPTNELNYILSLCPGVHVGVGSQDRSPLNMSQWNSDYFELKLPGKRLVQGNSDPP